MQTLSLQYYSSSSTDYLFCVLFCVCVLTGKRYLVTRRCVLQAVTAKNTQLRSGLIDGGAALANTNINWTGALATLNVGYR